MHGFDLESDAGCGKTATRGREQEVPTTTVLRGAAGDTVGNRAARLEARPSAQRSELLGRSRQAIQTAGILANRQALCQNLEQYSATCYATSESISVTSNR